MATIISMSVLTVASSLLQRVLGTQGEIDKASIVNFVTVAILAGIALGHFTSLILKLQQMA